MDTMSNKTKSALSSVRSKIHRYPKTLATVGFLTTCGVLIYNKQNIQKFFSRFVSPKPHDVDRKKRPDYIYIKYHIYRESMLRKKQQEEEDKKWISVITNPVGKWWKAAKHSVAWRLLRIAQTGSQQERLKAVRQMASIDHLKDWDFRHLAQICDARTAVSLARSGADVRWFTPVHMNGCIKNPRIMLADLRDMLAKLKPNSCVDYFFQKYFPEQDPTEDIDEFFTQDQILPMSVQETDLLKEIISFLHHLTKEPDAAKHIMEQGGLVQLMELRKIFATDNETLSTLCKVLANISLVEDSVEHFFQSGWVSVLAEWQQCCDLRLQVIAAKAMANLDHDDPNYTLYPPNVYPLHPRKRTRTKPKADIVFVHGLLGGVFITWRQKDRRPMELGLYGRNAFYTNDTDDVFLVGEHRRFNNNNKKYGMKEENVGHDDPVLKTATRHEEKPLDISDSNTKEIVETLRSEAEMGSDWEVVHPDVPLYAAEGCTGEYSVPGNKWQNQDYDDEYTNCWPMEWLPYDHPNTRVIGIDYTSAVTEWSANFTKYCPCEKGQGHIDVRATSLLERISMSDVGANRPVVWIGHSMGGILTKLVLMKAHEHPDPKVSQLARNTSGIVFLGTPHRGSPIAKWKQHMQMILSPSIEVKEMEEGAPNLLRLHARFMKCLHTCFSNIKVVSIAEGSPTMLTTFKFPLRIVTEESARIDYGDFYILKDDHLSLSKPIFRQSFLYQRLLKVIDESIQNGLPPPPTEEDPLNSPAATTIHSQNAEKGGSSLSWTNAKKIFSLLPKVTFKFLTSVDV